MNMYPLPTRRTEPAPKILSGGGNFGKPPMDNLLERITKIETILPTLATREDLIREPRTLRAEMHKEFTAQTWKIIGLFTTSSGALVGIMYYIAKL